MTNEDLKEAIDKGFGGVHERLDALNGRTRANEVAVAVLQDRSTRGGVFGGIAGSIGGVLGGMLAGWMGSK